MGRGYNASGRFRVEMNTERGPHWVTGAHPHKPGWTLVLLALFLLLSTVFHIDFVVKPSPVLSL